MSIGSKRKTSSFNRPLVIIHFQPIEFYPPLQNLVNALRERDLGRRVIVFTTKPAGKVAPDFDGNSSRTAVIRVGKSGGRRKGNRYFNYILFYGIATLKLVSLMPCRILYYDTLSSFPALIYKQWINRHSEILVHYHEYTTPAEYKQGMALARYFHRQEKKFYPSVFWLSQTNTDRLQLFLEDNPTIPANKTHVWPNYPPKAWASKAKTKINSPVRLVYAGAVGLTTMYLRELVEWVRKKPCTVSLDIYSLNISDDAAAFLKNHIADNIVLKKGVSYSELPGILPNYDVGLILYKGHIPNYVYNAPNKLFEYAILGLDVWFPEEMKGCIPYVTSRTFPQIRPVNFTNLPNVDIHEATDRENLDLDPINYSLEETLPEFLKAFSGNIEA